MSNESASNKERNKVTVLDICVLICIVCTFEGQRALLTWRFILVAFNYNTILYILVQHESVAVISYKAYITGTYIFF